MTIDECVFGRNIMQIGFDQSDRACQSHNVETDALHTNGRFHVSTGLDSCGTTHGMTDPFTIGFFNTLSVIHRHSSNSIQIRSNMNVDIACLFSTTLVTGNTTVIQSSHGSGSTTSHGEFQFFASYFSDSSFLHAPVDIGNLGRELYLGVYPYQALAGVQFYVSSCTITDGVHSYAIVDDGCASPLGRILSPYTTQTMFKLKYTTFKFTGNSLNDIV